MADLRSTIDIIKKRKKDIEDAVGGNTTTTPNNTSKASDPTDLLSDAAIDAEVKRRKAAQPKKGWLW